MEGDWLLDYESIVITDIVNGRICTLNNDDIRGNRLDNIKKEYNILKVQPLGNTSKGIEIVVTNIDLSNEEVDYIKRHKENV